MTDATTRTRSQPRRIVGGLFVAAASVGLFVLNPSCRNALRNAWIEARGAPASAVIVAVETSEYTENRRPLTRLACVARPAPRGWSSPRSRSECPRGQMSASTDPCGCSSVAVCTTQVFDGAMPACASP
jgi:hypothetical protein